MTEEHESTEPQRVDCIICGRKIGTATGWDQADTFVMTLYGLIGSPEYMGPHGDVSIDFECGMIDLHDDEGVIIQSADLIVATQGCQIVRPDQEISE